MRVLLFLGAVVWASGGARIPVTDWSLDYGYCGAASPWLRRASLAPISASPGDVVDVRYASDETSGAAVLRFADEDAWDACDASRATVLADAAGAGGPCANASDFYCLAVERGVEVAVPANGEALFLGASGMHCVGGVKVRVDVGAPSRTAASGPRDIAVEPWSDAYGFCGVGAGAGAARPDGHATIIAHEGDALVFKYAKAHNVAVAKTRADFEECAVARMAQVGTPSAGGGCASDASLGPYGSAAGAFGYASLSKFEGYSGPLYDVTGGLTGGARLDVDYESGELRLSADLGRVSLRGEVHLHEGASCDDPGKHRYPGYDEDPWADGGAGLAAAAAASGYGPSGYGTSVKWTADSNGNAKVRLWIPRLALADALLRAVVVHDVDGFWAACGVVRYVKPSPVEDCIGDQAGFRYELALDDARAERLAPAAAGAADGAVAIRFACQVQGHCARGQRLEVLVLPRPAPLAAGDDDGAPPPPVPAAAPAPPSSSGDGDDEEFRDDVEWATLVLFGMVSLCLAIAVGILLYERKRARRHSMRPTAVSTRRPSESDAIELRRNFAAESLVVEDDESEVPLKRHPPDGAPSSGADGAFIDDVEAAGAPPPFVGDDEAPFVPSGGGSTSTRSYPDIPTF